MATTEADITQRVGMLRAAQRAYQSELQNAEQLEVEALAAEQTAKDAQTKALRLADEARTAIRHYAEEIDQLIVEWRQLLPEQRKPL